MKPAAGGSALIFLPDSLFRRFFPFPVYPDSPVCPEIQIGMDKSGQAVSLILQNIVGTPAYNHAGAFPGQPENDLSLYLPEIVLIGWIKIPGRKCGSQKTGRESSTPFRPKNTGRSRAKPTPKTTSRIMERAVEASASIMPHRNTKMKMLLFAWERSPFPRLMLTKAQQPSPIMTAMARATTVSGKTTVLAAFPETDLKFPWGFTFLSNLYSKKACCLCRWIYAAGHTLFLNQSR